MLMHISSSRQCMQFGSSNIWKFLLNDDVKAKISIEHVNLPGFVRHT